MTLQAGVHVRAGTLTLPALTFADGTCAATITGTNTGPIFTCLGDARICGLTLAGNTLEGDGAGIKAATGTVSISNCCLENLHATRGGAIAADGTNLTLANTMCRKNTASESGGAIFQIEGHLTIPGLGCRAPTQPCGFVGNETEGPGGAIEAVAVVIEIASCHFERNRAKLSGGAIDATQGSLRLSETCLFQDNHSDESAGGAIACGACPVDDSGTLFEKNRAFQGGGAIYALNSSLTLHQSKFRKNRTVQYRGGAVSANGHDSVVTCTGCRFERNRTLTAGHGDPDAIISRGSGGGLALGNGATATLDPATVFLRNRAARDGGGVHVIGASSKLTIVGTEGQQTLFEGNRAADDGGGISVTEFGQVEATWGRWLLNRAEGSFGGGAHLTCRAVGTFTNCVFTENRAAIAGGAAFVHNAEGHFGSTESKITTFTSNRAVTGRGGAIFARSNAEILVEGFCQLGTAILEITKKCAFTGNTAGAGGGAIGLRGVPEKAIDFKIENSIFSENVGEPDPDASTPVHEILAIRGTRTSSIAPHSISSNQFDGVLKNRGDAIRLIEYVLQEEEIVLFDDAIKEYGTGIRSNLALERIQQNTIENCSDTGILLVGSYSTINLRNHLNKNRRYQIRIRGGGFAFVNTNGLNGGGASEVGVSVDEPSDGAIVSNDIAGHTKFGVEKLGNPTSPLLATTNWWGHPTGANPPGSGDKISANVNAANPWPTLYGW